jgi:hypothetical protein
VFFVVLGILLHNLFEMVFGVPTPHSFVPWVLGLTKVMFSDHVTDFTIFGSFFFYLQLLIADIYGLYPLTRTTAVQKYDTITKAW